MFQQTALTITVVAAVGCTVLSALLAVYFLRHRKKRLGLAVSFMLIGEALGMGVVSTFAILELVGVLQDFDPIASTAIRWVAITATAASTIHLARQVRKVIHE